MRWLLRVLRLSPRNGDAAETARRRAEAKLREARRREQAVRREVDQLAATMERALRGRPT